MKRFARCTLAALALALPALGQANPRVAPTSRLSMSASSRKDGSGGGRHAEKRVSAPPIDINSATVEDFRKLPGIGPKMAQQIVSYRQKHGPFRRIEDLLIIRGMGGKRFRVLRPYLRVGKPRAAGVRIQDSGFRVRVQVFRI